MNAHSIPALPAMADADETRMYAEGYSMRAILRRLDAFVAERQIPVSEHERVLLSVPRPDEPINQDFLTFATKHNVTLDWLLMGKLPVSYGPEPASAETLLPPAVSGECRVASIAKIYGQLTAARQTADEETRGRIAGFSMEQIDALRDDLEQRATLLIPNSATGAAFLVAILNSTAGIVRDCQLTADREEILLSRISRCAYRLAEYHRNNGAELAQVVWDYHMPDYADPASGQTLGRQ